MKLTTRLTVVISVIIVGVALFAGTALANNTHTTGNWWHGLGDGKDGDYYIHPFNDARNNGNYTTYVGWTGYHRGGDSKTRRCYRCEHNHLSKNTSYHECSYYSYHEWYNHNVNQWYAHDHYHHNWCGYLY